MPGDLPEASFVFLPSVGSWLVVPPPATRRQYGCGAAPPDPVKIDDLTPALPPQKPAAAAAAATAASPTSVATATPTPTPTAPAASAAPAATAVAAPLTSSGKKVATVLEPPAETPEPAARLQQEEKQQRSPAGKASPDSRASSPLGATTPPPKAPATAQPGSSSVDSAGSPLGSPAPKGGLKAGPVHDEDGAGAGLGVAGVNSAQDGVLREFKVVVPKPYPGVQYRKSRNLNDRWPRYAQNEAIVRGIMEKNGQWLRLEQNIFLPMRVGNITILQPHPPGDRGSMGMTGSAAAGATMSTAQSGAAGGVGSARAQEAQSTRRAEEAMPWWSCCTVCNSTAAADTEVLVPPAEHKQQHLRGSNSGGRGNNLE